MFLLGVSTFYFRGSITGAAGEMTKAAIRCWYRSVVARPLCCVSLRCPPALSVSIELMSGGFSLRINVLFSNSAAIVGASSLGMQASRA